MQIGPERYVEIPPVPSTELSSTNEIEILSRSLKRKEKEEEKKFSLENDFVHVAHGATSILFSLLVFLFFLLEANRLENRLPRFIDSKTRSGRDEIEKRGRREGRRRGGLYSLDLISNLRSLCLPLPRGGEIERERERTYWYSCDFHTGSSVTRNHQSFPLSLSYCRPCSASLERATRSRLPVLGLSRCMITNFRLPGTSIVPTRRQPQPRRSNELDLREGPRRIRESSPSTPSCRKSEIQLFSRIGKRMRGIK